jgi:hypothetical protein
MSHGKDPSPLFEIIHKSPKSARRGVRVPDWMRQAEEMEQRVEAAEPNTASGATGGPPRWVAWWFRSVRFRLQLGVLVMCGVAVAAAVVVALFVGMEIENRQSLELARTYDEFYRQEIEPRQEENPDYGLVPTGVERTSPIPAGVTPPPRHRGAAGSPDDPRQPGFNYFRLIELPTSAREEGSRAVTFLKENGVDAAMIPVNNGRSYKLLALRGFDRIGVPEAKTYRERLEMLGRLWKAKHKGSSDWHDLIAEKYVPGRT